MTPFLSRRIGLAAAGLLLAGFAAFLFSSDAGPVRDFAFVDFFDYYFAGDAVAAGISPYDAAAAEMRARSEGVPVIHRSPFIYPSWVATLLVPFSLLPPWWAAAAWYLLSALALLWTIDDAVQRRRLPGSSWAAALLFPPTLFTLFVGQVNAFLLALLWYAWSRREDHPSRAGVALGLAIGIKLNPLLLALPLAAARRWRVLAAVTVTGLVCIAIGELASPGSTQEFARQVLPGLSSLDPGHAHPVNQGLKGFFLRLFVPNPWTRPFIDSPELAAWSIRIVTALVVSALAVLCWLRGRTHERETWAFTGAAMIALSPLAWESQFVMALLPFALLWHPGFRARVAIVWFAIAAQRALDDFANHPDDHPVLRACPPLSSVALAGLAALFVFAFVAALKSGKRGIE